ncbi:hypothetical protein [Streptomyces sp. CBMA123]|uniref:hypothetical protein n=1 Tax=Streptomyces sp. CBMA123 TaxID=1896313 RepID=UPI003983040C
MARADRELVGGPPDGLLLDVTGWDTEQLADGAALITEIGRYGADGRAHYEPRPNTTGRSVPKVL